MYLPVQLAAVGRAAARGRFAAMTPAQGTAAGVARAAGLKQAGGVSSVAESQQNGTYVAGSQVPIGNTASWLSNRTGGKFQRGWLDGAGGADIEHALGSTAFDIRPTPYTSRELSKWLGAGPLAPVPGLANWDVESPDRTFGPLQQARAEWIPTTWSNRMAGVDVVSGNLGPREATARFNADAAPTPQVYWRAQLREGGEADPSIPFGPNSAGPKKKVGRFGRVGMVS